MKKTIIILAAFVIVLLGLFVFYGGCYKITIQNINTGGETLIYEAVTGPYSQSFKVSDKIHNDLLDSKIETTKCLGIYYDNPKNVDKDKLRSEIGCIVENVDSETIEKLKTKYSVKILPNENYIVAEFPYKGSLSILMGIKKVYPAIEKYSKENNYADAPIMEIYDVPNKKIIYRKFINN